MSHHRFILVLFVTAHSNYHPTAYLKIQQSNTNQLILSIYAYCRHCALHFPLIVKKDRLYGGHLPPKKRNKPKDLCTLSPQHSHFILGLVLQALKLFALSFPNYPSAHRDLSPVWHSMSNILSPLSHTNRH